MRARKLPSGVTVVLLILFAAACAPAVDPDPNHLVVWAWPGGLQALESGYAAFRLAHPDIEVTFVEIPWAGGGLPTKLQVAVMARSGAPDVTGLMNVSAPPFVDYGALVDVTDLLGEERSRFPAYKLRECQDRAGRLRGVPWDIAPTGLFYRKDLFERYGETLPETWGGFIEVGRRMAARGHYMLTLSNVFDGPVLETFEYLLRQQGGRYFAEGGALAINCPETARAMDLLLRMREADIAIDAGQGAAEWGLYKRGAILCRIRPAYDANLLPDYVGERPEDGYGHWRVGLLPAFERGGARASSGVSSILAIPGQSTRQEAAWTYVRFMTTTVDGARTQTEYGGLAAYLPSLTIPEVIDFEHPFFGGQQINRVFLELNGHVLTGFSTHPCIEEARRILADEFEPVWQGKSPIQPALDRAEERIRAAQEQYQ